MSGTGYLVAGLGSACSPEHTPWKQHPDVETPTWVFTRGAMTSGTELKLVAATEMWVGAGEGGEGRSGVRPAAGGGFHGQEVGGRGSSALLHQGFMVLVPPTHHLVVHLTVVRPGSLNICAHCQAMDVWLGKWAPTISNGYCSLPRPLLLPAHLSLSLCVCIIHMYNICIYAIDMYTYADTSVKPGLCVNMIHIYTRYG